jgi:heat shock protein HslJ/uncharacterized lipoprotein NlpE involved in copper resistance
MALPATFRGVLPCADCEGIEHTITLHADGSYWNTERYLGLEPGSNDTFRNLGQWTAAGTPDRIELRAMYRAPEFWVRESATTLRKLDTQGRAIESSLPYTLARLGAAEQRFGPVRVSGMFRYEADAAVLTSCESGARYSVVAGEGYLALERAYLETRPAPGAELLVTTTVRLVPKPAGEEGWPIRMEVVSLDRVVAGVGCNAGPPLTPESGPWIVGEVDGERVAAAEPLEMLWSEGRFSGFTGCNRVMGAYTLSGNVLTHGPLTATRRACAESMDLEAKLTRALAETVAWRSRDNGLELLDAGSVTRLRLRSLPAECD